MDDIPDIGHQMHTHENAKIIERFVPGPLPLNSDRQMAMARPAVRGNPFSLSRTCVAAGCRQNASPGSRLHRAPFGNDTTSEDLQKVQSSIESDRPMVGVFPSSRLQVQAWRGTRPRRLRSTILRDQVGETGQHCRQRQQ